MAPLDDASRYALARRAGARLVADWPTHVWPGGRPLAVSADGARVGVTAIAGGIEIYTVADPTRPPARCSFGPQARCLAFAPDGELLAGANAGDASVLIRWPLTGRPYARNVQRDPHANDDPTAEPGVSFITVAPDGRRAMLVAERIAPTAERVGLLEGVESLRQGALWSWDLATNRTEWGETIGDPLAECAYTPDSGQIVYRNGLRIEERSAATGRRIAKHALRLDAPGVVFSRDASCALVTWRPDERPGARDAMAVIALPDGRILFPLAPGHGPGLRLRPLDLSADGQLALGLSARPADTGEEACAVCVWDTLSGQLIDVIDRSAFGRDAAYDSAVAGLVAAGNTEPFGPLDARFLPDGGFVVATRHAGLLRFSAVPTSGLAPSLPGEVPGPGNAPTLGC